MEEEEDEEKEGKRNKRTKTTRTRTSKECGERRWKQQSRRSYVFATRHDSSSIRRWHTQAGTHTT